MADQVVYDLVVIGAGPGGYVGAIRAAQLGLKVVSVERDRLGGVCLNWGCIPTKALLAGAEFYARIKHEADDWGIRLNLFGHDWQKVIARSRTVAGNLNKGITALFKKNGITHVRGSAKIVQPPRGSTPGRVEVAPAAGDPQQPATETLLARHVLIATGAAPRPLPDHGFDGQTIISAKEAMTLPQQPDELIIVGAGAIGMEFAYFYNAFGTHVTVIEMMDRPLPIEDQEVSKQIAKAFRRQGVELRTAHKPVAIQKDDGAVQMTIAPVNGQGPTETLRADAALVAIGVRGSFDGLFGDGLNVEQVKGHLRVDRSTYQTSVDGVYAVGDVIGPPWLAHVASEEAVVCVERIAGHDPLPVDYDAVPGCTYCHPQVASVGLTEEACRERGLAYRVGRFPFRASGKAQAAGHVDGFVKIIAGADHGQVLGAHMVGEGVTELIAEVGLAMRLEATAEELIATMHAHPTLSEAVHEAALGTEGRMLHA